MAWTVAINTVTINLEYVYLYNHQQPTEDFYDHIVDGASIGDTISATFDDYEKAKAYMLYWYGYFVSKHVNPNDPTHKVNCTFYRGGSAIATITRKYTVFCNADMLTHVKLTLKNESNDEDIKAFNIRWKRVMNANNLFDNYPEEFDKFWTGYFGNLPEEYMPNYLVKPHRHVRKSKKSKKNRS